MGIVCLWQRKTQHSIVSKICRLWECTITQALCGKYVNITKKYMVHSGT